MALGQTTDPLVKSLSTDKVRVSFFLALLNYHTAIDIELGTIKIIDLEDESNQDRDRKLTVFSLAQLVKCNLYNDDLDGDSPIAFINTIWVLRHLR